MHSLITVLKKKHIWITLAVALLAIPGASIVLNAYECEISAWFHPKQTPFVRAEPLGYDPDSLWKIQPDSKAETKNADCQIPEVLTNKAASHEAITVLADRASGLFKDGHLACALTALGGVSQTVNSPSLGVDRTINGYLLKEVVFQAIEDKKLADEALRRKEVRLSLQSLLDGGRISPHATVAERINDAAFLFRVATWMKEKEKDQSDPCAYILLMLHIAGTIETDKRPYSSYDLVVLAEWMLERSAYAKIVSMLELMPRDPDREQVIYALLHKIPYSIGKASRNSRLLNLHAGSTSPVPYADPPLDKDATLRYADEAERLLNVLTAEAVVIKSNAPPPFPNSLYKFIWQSYFVAGSKCEAKKKMASWIAAIRQLRDPAQRFNALFSAAENVYHLRVERSVAVSLFQEAEKEAVLIADPRYKKNAEELISRFRIMMGRS